MTAGGEHREWQGLVCETRPMAQPEDKPELAVSQHSYNVWDASEAVSETFGTTKRTKAKTFDAAGRVTASEVSSYHRHSGAEDHEQLQRSDRSARKAEHDERRNDAHRHDQAQRSGPAQRIHRR